MFRCKMTKYTNMNVQFHKNLSYKVTADMGHRTNTYIETHY